MMKIGLNGQYLLKKNFAGPEVYTYKIFQALASVDKENEYVIYFSSKPTDEFFSKLTGGNTNFSYKVVSKNLSWTQIGLALELAKNPVDVFFTTIHTMPIFHKKNMKVVAMVHGLEFVFSEDYRNPLLRLFKSGRHEWYVSRFSDSLIVPSQATKDAILKMNWNGVTEEKLNVISEGVDPMFRKQDEEEIHRIKEKYGADKYLFYISTIEPRKNIPRLVEAFSLALKEDASISDTKLLLAGKKGWLFEESLEAPKKFGVEKNAKFIGRVPLEDVPGLFSGARAFVSTSLEEGFGLPLLEAMACGTTAIVSDISSYRFIGQDLPHFVNPEDINDIKEKILKVLGSKKDLDKATASINRAKEFTWEKAAEETLGIFNSTQKLY